MAKPADRSRMARPAAITDLLSAVLRGTPAEKRLSEGRIWQVWDRAVGSRIANRAQPVAFRDGVLTLIVDSGPWIQELSYFKGDMIAKVNRELDEELVKEIYMKAGRVRVPVQAAVGKPKPRPLTAEELALISEEAESITDPELRAVFESLIRRDRESRNL